MSQRPDTFTLELLGFDRQSPEQASVALASVLGLPPDDAAFYSRRAPVILRAQLPGTEAQQMAKAILDVGGRVRLTHDPSGQQRVYEPHSPLRPRTVPPELPPSEPLPGAAATDAVHPYPPARSETEEPSGPPVSVEPLTVRRPQSEPPADEPVLTRTRPPPRTTGERCAFCGHPRPPSVDTCPRCGWNWRLAERRCASCGGPVVLTSRRRSLRPRLKVLRGLLIAVCAVALAGFGYWSVRAYGFRQPLAQLAAFVAVVLILPLVQTAWRCDRCGTKPAPVYVDRDQRLLLLLRRIALASGIVVFAAAALALAAMP
jgi:hypothetical protein